MQREFLDWHLEPKFEEEQLEPLNHAGSGAYVPQMGVLTRLRMNMLTQLFARMNVGTVPAKRYSLDPAYRLQEEDLSSHPFLLKLCVSLKEFQDQSIPFPDYHPLKEMGGSILDALELYILSRSPISGGYELFYCDLMEKTLHRVKEAGADICSRLFKSGLGQEALEGAVFVTARANPDLRLHGGDGYRLSLLEGGRLIERLRLYTHSAGWTIQHAAEFCGPAVHELLGIDRHNETVAVCLIVKEVK